MHYVLQNNIQKMSNLKSITSLSSMFQFVLVIFNTTPSMKVFLFSAYNQNMDKSMLKIKAGETFS